jgi:glycosyltransferase involved in cell wall biosynthesis
MFRLDIEAQASSVPGAGDVAITAIIPVYNGAAFIGNAIRSVQAQRSAVASIFVVDDCSTDTTREIVTALAADDARIKLMTNDTNSGPSFSRNRALAATETPIAAFLDADDEWLPKHTEAIQSAFGNVPDASVAYTALPGQQAISGETNEKLETRILSTPVLTLLETNPLPQSATAVRTAHVVNVGGYNTQARYAEDFDLWMRLALRGATFVEIPIVTLSRSIHDAQVSVRHANRMYQSAWQIRHIAFRTHFETVGHGLDAAAKNLSRAQAQDLAAALNMRRRDIAKQLLSQTDWIPNESMAREKTKRLVGWRWPFWRTAAFISDCLPIRTKGWWRARRTASPEIDALES